MKRIIVTTSIFLFILALTFPNTSKATTIGAFCSSNIDCLSNDCEDNVCDCNDQEKPTSADCSIGLQIGTPQDWKCIDESLDPQKRGNEFCVKSTFPGGTYPNQSTDQVIYPISHKLDIGEQCETSDQCITGNCEDSNLDGKYDNYCVCDSPTNCQAKYGGDTSQWECRGHNVGSADDVNGLNYCYDKTTGHSQNAIPVSFDNVSISDVILRPQGVSDAFSSDISKLIQKPTPKINIPGLNFSDVDISQMTTTDDTGNTWLNIPFLGEYISAVYKYSIVIISLLAVIGIIISGVMLIGSGGNSDIVTKAKKRMMMSVIGIIIAVTSYSLLYLINPELVQFRNLKILYVKGTPFTEYENVSNEVANSTNGMENSNKLTTPTNVPKNLSVTSNPIPILIGGLPNSIQKCSTEAFQYAAQKLDAQHICTGSCHCAYTASHFLNYIGCTIQYTASAPALRTYAKTLGWQEVKIDNSNYKNLPIGLAIMTEGSTENVLHAGISLANGVIFDSSGKLEAFNKVNKATGNTCPPAREVQVGKSKQTVSPLFDIDPNDNSKNCSGCSLIPSEAPITGRWADKYLAGVGQPFYGSIIEGTGTGKSCYSVQFWAIRTQSNPAKEFNYIYIPTDFKN